MRFKPCYVRYLGRRYRVSADGTAAPILVEEPGNMVLGPAVDAATASDIRVEASRIRRNRRRRARHEAMTGLGLVRVKGNLGGTYYE